MLVTDSAETAITVLAKDYLPLWEGRIRLDTARNMVRLAAYSILTQDVPVVTEGDGCKVQVTYDGIQYCIREIS
jgi:hypothetical protein